MTRKSKGWYFRLIAFAVVPGTLVWIILFALRHFLSNCAFLFVNLLFLGISIFFIIVGISALTRARFQLKSPLRIGYQIVSNELELEELSEKKPVILVTQSAQPGAGEFNTLLIFERKILPLIASCIVDNEITIAWGNVGSFLHQSDLDSFFDKREVKKKGCFLIVDKHILRKKTLGSLNQYSIKKNRYSSTRTYSEFELAHRKL